MVDHKGLVGIILMAQILDYRGEIDQVVEEDSEWIVDSILVTFILSYNSGH
jgi:hypothetical protein